MGSASKKAVSNADRAANRERYAPRPRPVLQVVQPAAGAAQAAALKRLTAQVLDELKNPSAIPSQVILAALVKARQIK